MKPILISGIERSGCGIVSRLLAGHGVWTGSITGTGENKRLKGLVNAYYNFLGLDLKRQYPLPQPEKIYIDPMWQSRVKTCLETEGFDGKSRWLYKSSALLQTWPLWVKTFPEAIWVVVRRERAEVIHSCLHTGHMIAFSDRKIQQAIGVKSEVEGWEWWYDQHEQMIEGLKQSVRVLEIYPVEFRNYQRVSEFLLNFGIHPDFRKCNEIQRLIKTIDHED